MALRPACTACTAWLPVMQPSAPTTGSRVQELPELLRTQARQRMFDAYRAAKSRRIGGGVGALDAAPAGIGA